MKTDKSFFAKLLFVISVTALFLSGCSSENAKSSKSMEEIQRENGMPVVVNVVKKQPFEKHLNFIGNFEGIRQTVIGAMIGGRIEKIRHKPGDYVKKNEVIIQFPEDSPASQIQQAKAAYENSKKNYERIKALYKAGQTSKSNYDGIEAKYLVDKRNYETMRQMLFLDAPYSGMITDILVHEGDNVKKRTPLFVLANLSKMKIRIWLSDSERMEIKKGMDAFATVNGRTYKGKVSQISFGVDPMKQAFSADLVFDNSKREIFPGTTADVKIITNKLNNAIVVPRNLVKNSDSKNYVYVAKDGKAKIQYVTVSDESGIDYLIGSGLNAGDSLIVKGNGRLSDGIKINVVK